MKIQAFHKPNSNSGISDVVSLLQLTIINYLMLWYASARALVTNSVFGFVVWGKVLSRNPKTQNKVITYASRSE